MYKRQVVGYGGSQKLAALTTAITKMDDQVLKKAAYSNVGQSLQGSVSGLRYFTYNSLNTIFTRLWMTTSSSTVSFTHLVYLLSK